MILLDTNVLSELMRSEPNPAVIAWLDSQPVESLWTSTITVFDVRYGFEIMTTGRRRRDLEDAFAQVLVKDFADRVLSFDRPAAEASAIIAARHRSAGRNVDIRDVQIAGITAARRASLATRNIRDFDDIGITLINPWQMSPN